MKLLPGVVHDSYIIRASQRHRSGMQVVDEKAVASAAGALEGTAELLGSDVDQNMYVEVKLSVSELRNFVAYMRTLDRRYRELEKADALLKRVVEENSGLKEELSQASQRIKLMELSREPKESQETAPSRPKGRAIARLKRHLAKRDTRAGG